LALLVKKDTRRKVSRFSLIPVALPGNLYRFESWRRKLWVQIVKGEIRLNSRLLSVGDGDAAEDKPPFDLDGTEQHKTEFRLIDLA
jgi:hypothetical protein